MILDFGMGRDDPGRDDPARSSVIFIQWGIEYEEEDLASGGRSDLGRRAAPQPYLSSVIPDVWRWVGQKTEILDLISLDTDGLKMMRRDE